MVNQLVFLALVSFLLISCVAPGYEEEPGVPQTAAIWIDRGPDVGQYSSMASDEKGTPHVSYYDYTLGNLKYAVFNSENGEWEIQVLEQSGDTGLYTSLAIDSQNKPHILYFDASEDRLKYTWNDGSKWHSVDALEGHGGLFGSLALDAKDVAHITYITKDSKLHYLKKDFRHDVAQPVDQELDSGVFSADGMANPGATIKIRPDSKNPVIAYYSVRQGALQVLQYEPESEYARTEEPAIGWVRNVVDGASSESDVGEYVSLFVLSENEYHVSYHDKTLGDLKYAHWGGKRWTTEIVDKDGLVGEWSSITVFCNNKSEDITLCKPYISYYDHTNNDLKLAVRRADGNWVTFRADLSGMTGTYTNIGQVRRGRGGITYRDLTFSGLKFLLFLPF